MKRISGITLAIVAIISCQRQELQVTRQVTLELCDTEVKTGLDEDRSHIIWKSGDAITVYNNTGQQTVRAVYTPSTTIVVQVPEAATSLKATWPETEGSYDNPGFVFETSQTQALAGSLDGVYYPMVAQSAITTGSASLKFSSVGSAFAINVFNPTVEGEVLQSVSVQPSQKAEPVKVTLGTPWTILKDKPADKKSYPGQVYACIGKGGYSQIEFIVTTDYARYIIQSNSTEMPLYLYDFFAVNLDLKNLEAHIDVSTSAEGFSVEPIDSNVTSIGAGFVELIDGGLEPQLTRDTIPDFSTVGYRWGERPFPDYSNVIRLPYPSGDDDTDMIQNAIDTAPDKSVILFQKGKYIVDSILFITRSNIILRGSGDRETEIFARGTVPLSGVRPDDNKVFHKEHRHLINIGYCSDINNRCKQISNSVAYLTLKNINNKLLEDHPDAWYVHGSGFNSSWRQVQGTSTPIIEDVYCGSTFVTVRDASSFNVGDKVIVYRNCNDKWIHDIKMDMIIKALNDVGTITQWTAAGYKMSWERVVKEIHGNRLYFDASLVQSITAEYGGGSVIHCSSTRVKEVGIENLKIVSDYNPDRDYIHNGRRTMGDIYHANDAIDFYGAEHCWVKDVDTYRFASCAVAMAAGAKNITVQGCNQYEPAAYIRGGLRYAFHINGGTNCLVRDCTSDWDRHQWVTAGKVPGPNVFFNCISTNAQSNIGPHQRWATGTLYDHVATQGEASVVDAGNSGTGQGWQGANQVFWRCRASKYYFQDPWVTGRNYAIGCMFSGGADATNTVYDPYANPGYAPDGSQVYDRLVNGPRIMSEVRPLKADEPESLYLDQLQKRLASGNLMSNFIPD